MECRDSLARAIDSRHFLLVTSTQTAKARMKMSNQVIEPTPPVPDPKVTPPETIGGKTFTQEEVDHIISERLAREKKKGEDDNRKIKEKVDAEALAKNQEWQKLAETREKELAEATTKLKGLEIEKRKQAIASKVGLPEAFAQRLQGETDEELEKDAKLLLEALPKAPKIPALGATNPGTGASQGETYEQQWARIHGQSVNPWDPNVHRQQGGGIFFATPEEGGKD